MSPANEERRLNWAGYYDIVILPPAPLRDYSIRLSRQLAGSWVLGRRNFLPHISIYHIPVRVEDFGAFARDVDRIGESTPWGELETTGFDMQLLMLSKPEWLDALHRRVVRRTLRYFNRQYEAENTWSLQSFSGRRREFAKRYLREYGTPMYGMNFRPHITLSSAAPAGDLPYRRMRFRPSRLRICELGESHSCQRIVR